MVTRVGVISYSTCNTYLYFSDTASRQTYVCIKQPRCLARGTSPLQIFLLSPAGTRSPITSFNLAPPRPYPQRRRNEGAGARGKDERQKRGNRRSQVADRALRERYYAVLQRKDGRSTLSERIKTLRRMVLAQGGRVFLLRSEKN